MLAFDTTDFTKAYTSSDIRVVTFPQASTERWLLSPDARNELACALHDSDSAVHLAFSLSFTREYQEALAQLVKVSWTLLYMSTREDTHNSTYMYLHSCTNMHTATFIHSLISVCISACKVPEYLYTLTPEQRSVMVQMVQGNDTSSSALALDIGLRTAWCIWVSDFA